LNRLTAVQYVSDSVTVHYSYNALGCRTAMTGTLGTTRYEYDAARRLITTTLPNGVVSVNQYDDANRLIDLSHTASDDTLLSSFSYELDGAGNHLQVVETLSTGSGQALTGTTRVITNTYDPLGRLTGSEYSTGESFVYVYDAVGNRTLVTSTTPLSGTVVTTSVALAGTARDTFVLRFALDATQTPPIASPTAP
jgi:YD repeat-containing protein